jgi:hypothetical protein
MPNVIQRGKAPGAPDPAKQFPYNVEIICTNCDPPTIFLIVPGDKFVSDTNSMTVQIKCPVCGQLQTIQNHSIGG